MEVLCRQMVCKPLDGSLKCVTNLRWNVCAEPNKVKSPIVIILDGGPEIGQMQSLTVMHVPFRWIIPKNHPSVPNNSSQRPGDATTYLKMRLTIIISSRSVNHPFFPRKIPLV